MTVGSHGVQSVDKMYFRKWVELGLTDYAGQVVCTAMWPWVR